MKQMKLMLGAVLVVSLACSCKQQTVATAPPPGLKDVVEGKFTMGVAVTPREVTDTNAVKLIKQHFNSIVAENVMKSMIIHPAEDHYNFASADTIVNFAHENGMEMIGHCLIWHSQLAKWFCVDKDGKPVTPEVLKQRMKDHITTILTHYKGKIKGYDVVNEAILEDGSYRKSPFYEILGEEFIPLAFQYAHEADPDAELYYNDYGMEWNNFKHDNILDLVNRLVKDGAEIDGIGLQTHTDVSRNVSHIENAIRDAGNTGLMVHVSEMDVDLFVDDYTGPVTQELLQQQSDRFAAASRALLNLPSNKIFGLTTWGVSDNQALTSEGDQYSLLFDENYQPKLAYYGIASTFPSESEE